MKRFLRSNISSKISARLKFHEDLKLSSIYFQQKRSFSNQNNEKNFEDEDTEESAESFKYFIPKNTMSFKDDVSLFYIFHEHHKTRRMFLAVLCLFGFISYKCFEKLYNYQDRNIFGLLLYSILGIYSLRLCRTSLRQASLMVDKMSLCRDGTNIMVETHKYGLYPYTRMVDIAIVSRPQNDPEEVFVGRNFGMKIYIGEEGYTLPKYGQIINEEVLRAVLNGYYIQIDPNRVVYN